MIGTDTIEKPKRTKRTTTDRSAARKENSGLVPHTAKQKDCIDALSSSNQIFILGPAETSTTNTKTS